MAAFYLDPLSSTAPNRTTADLSAPPSRTLQGPLLGPTEPVTSFDIVLTATEPLS